MYGPVVIDRLEDRERWTTRHTAILVIGVALGVAIRIALLPTQGLRGDIDQFVGWLNHIAVAGLPNTFEQELTFGPVVAYIWWFLGLVEPGFRTATDASDTTIRILMKLPATLADFGLAAGVAFGLRARPTWAVVGAVAILLHPAVWYVSAWWGQYESVFVLWALIATLFAINGRDGFAAAFLAAAVLTKPQAVPLLVPFAAWFFARGGVAGLGRATLIGAVTALVIWLPFLAAGGPLDYLRGVSELQGDVFSILSLRAWNLWWLVQEIGNDGQFASDRVSLIGPITFRMVGFAITGLLAIVVAFGVRRDPRPRTLIVGLAAIMLVAFSFLTTMHERYAFAAVVFLMLLIPESRMRWLAVAFGAVFTLNLVAAIPASPELGRALPVAGPLGIVGSVAMITMAVVAVALLRDPPTPESGRSEASVVVR